MAAKPTVLVTGVSGNLGPSLLKQLDDCQVIGVDVDPPPAGAGVFRFEKIDLAEERSCEQMLELMRTYRPEAVVHLAFVVDPVPAAIVERRAAWQVNVVGTSRVLEAVAEHNRTIGGIEKFIFPSSAMIYGPEPKGPVLEDAALNAQSLPYALHQQEADITVQIRANSLRKCKTYILRSQVYAGADVENHHLAILRGTPGTNGRLGRALRRSGAKLPFLLPAGGNYLDHRLQFVHIDDVARLISHIARRKETDPQRNVLNVAGSGEALTLRRCIDIAGTRVKRKLFCRQALRLRWKMGISDIPPAALPYLLGSCELETAKLRAFLGEQYGSVIQFTCEDALRASFGAPKPEAAAALAGSRV